MYLEQLTLCSRLMCSCRVHAGPCEHGRDAAAGFQLADAAHRLLLCGQQCASGDAVRSVSAPTGEIFRVWEHVPSTRALLSFAIQLEDDVVSACVLTLQGSVAESTLVVFRVMQLLRRLWL